MPDSQLKNETSHFSASAEDHDVSMLRLKDYCVIIANVMLYDVNFKIYIQMEV